MDEVTGAVIAIAFGLSAVFIPVAFISGITGQFYRQFALTIAVSTLLSAFNSLTLSPALAALLLRPRQGKQDWLTTGLDVTLGWFFRLFNRGLEFTTGGYVAVVRRLVRFSALALLVYVALLALTYKGFRSVPTGFIPQQDTGYLIVNLQMPDATSTDRTDAVMRPPGRGREQHARRGRHVRDHGLLGDHRHQPEQRRRDVRRAEEVRGAGRPPGADRAGGGRAAAGAVRARAGGVRAGLPAPAGAGDRHGRRVQDADRGPAGVGTPQELQAVTERVMAAAREDHRVGGAVLEPSARPCRSSTPTSTGPRSSSRACR